jgi:hypothetical protein
MREFIRLSSISRLVFARRGASTLRVSQRQV